MAAQEKTRVAPIDLMALERVRAHIDENLGRTVTTDELCRVALMSTSKLTRLFKRTWGATPQEYARTLRMEQACRMLAGSDLSLTEISQRLGFVRLGSFSEAFHGRIGCTPSEYRNRAHERREV
mgnify:CR=1 FL=1